jgi:hypothetical protein
MTSVVWNYKYADVEFGRLQARDLLQHLWTGPISNAPVDIVQVCEPQARRHRGRLAPMPVAELMCRARRWAAGAAGDHVLAQ